MFQNLRTRNYGSARWIDCNRGMETLSREQLHVLDGSYFSKEQIGKRGAFLLGRIEDGDASKVLNDFLTEEKMTAAKANPNSRYLGWRGDGHLITIAPTRSGKGVGVVIPNLLSYPGSVIVIDPKGENYAVTADFRKKEFGQTIMCLDPFGVTKNFGMTGIDPVAGAGVLNPFDLLDKNSPDIFDDAGALAEAMVIRVKDQKEPHWDDKATSVIKTFLLAVASIDITNGGKTFSSDLGTARALLSRPEEDFYNLLGVLESEMSVLNGSVARGAAEIRSMPPNEWGSVISSVHKHMEFLESPRALSSLTGRSTYNIMDLKKKGKVSVYIVIPPHYMSQYSRLIRLWLTMFIMAVTKVDGPPKDGLPVLFLMDEVAQLGRLEILLRAVSLLGGYGAAFWMIWQNLSQLKGLYPDEWSSFLANAKIQQFFGVNDLETAGYISEALGNETIQTSSYNFAQADAAAQFSKMSGGAMLVEKERALLTKDEIRRLNREMSVILVQGCMPILTRRFTYYTDDEFKNIAAKNPWH